MLTLSMRTSKVALTLAGAAALFGEEVAEGFSLSSSQKSSEVVPLLRHYGWDDHVPARLNQVGSWAKCRTDTLGIQLNHGRAEEITVNCDHVPKFSESVQCMRIKPSNQLLFESRATLAKMAKVSHREWVEKCLQPAIAIVKECYKEAEKEDEPDGNDVRKTSRTAAEEERRRKFRAFEVAMKASKAQHLLTFPDSAEAQNKEAVHTGLRPIGGWVWQMWEDGNTALGDHGPLYVAKPTGQTHWLSYHHPISRRRWLQDKFHTTKTRRDGALVLGDKYWAAIHTEEMQRIARELPKPGQTEEEKADESEETFGGIRVLLGVGCEHKIDDHDYAAGVYAKRSHPGSMSRDDLTSEAMKATKGTYEQQEEWQDMKQSMAYGFDYGQDIPAQFLRRAKTLAKDVGFEEFSVTRFKGELKKAQWLERRHNHSIGFLMTQHPDFHGHVVTHMLKEAGEEYERLTPRLEELKLLKAKLEEAKVQGMDALVQAKKDGVVEEAREVAKACQEEYEMEWFLNSLWGRPMTMWSWLEHQQEKPEVAEKRSWFMQGAPSLDDYYPVRAVKPPMSEDEDEEDDQHALFGGGAYPVKPPMSQDEDEEDDQHSVFGGGAGVILPEENQPEEDQPEEDQPEEDQPEEDQPEEDQPEETQREGNQPEETQREGNQKDESQRKGNQQDESQQEFVQNLQEKIRHLQQQNLLLQQQNQGPNVDDLEVRIEKLDRLLARGRIDQEEYDEHRKRILQSI